MGNIIIANCIELLLGDKSFVEGQKQLLEFLSREKVAGEMAWHTFRRPIDQIPKSTLTHLRDESAQLGVTWVAQHWVGFNAPEYFQLTSADPNIQKKTGEYLALQNNALFHIRNNIAGGVTVIGSPKQRNRLPIYFPTVSLEDGLRYFGETIAYAIQSSPDSGVIMAPERLVKLDGGKGETNIVYTMEQAVAVAYHARRSPRCTPEMMDRVKVMVDCKAAWGNEETVIDSFKQIPKDLISYHVHVQGQTVSPPGFNDEGHIVGKGYHDIGPEIEYLVRKAHAGNDVVLSIEAFPPFVDTWKKTLRNDAASIADAYKYSNAYLRERIKMAEDKIKPEKGISPKLKI